MVKALFYIPIASWFMTLFYGGMIGAIYDYHERVAILGHDIRAELLCILAGNTAAYTAFRLYKRFKRKDLP